MPEKDQKEIAMVPDSSRDAVFAVVYVYGRVTFDGRHSGIIPTSHIAVIHQLEKLSF